VITGLIKANVPARVAFSVASQVDSRTILDMAGAEKLVGNGDMLYMSGDKARPVRIQGGFVSEEEVRRVVEEVKRTGEPDYDDAIVAQLHKSGVGGVRGESDDPLLEEAKRLVTQAGKASASLLQRRLRVGYARAARMLDMLEDAGVIGEAEGNKPRPVLIDGADDTPEETEYDGDSEVVDEPRKEVTVKEEDNSFSDNQEEDADNFEGGKQW
jgi:S-DNA-T family DNA segregation ATPase FtsK/SpoIIIE